MNNKSPHIHWRIPDPEQEAKKAEQYLQRMEAERAYERQQFQDLVKQKRSRFSIDRDSVKILIVATMAFIMFVMIIALFW